MYDFVHQQLQNCRWEKHEFSLGQTQSKKLKGHTMNISLSDHFTYKKLLRFTFPSIVMMILTSIYGVVDGVFVSNFVGSEAFASINIIMPFLMILGAIGFMTGSGGSALVALTFGIGNEKRQRRSFLSSSTF